MARFNKKQKIWLNKHFVDGYKPTERQYIEMYKKLKLKKRIPESFYK